MKLTMAIRKNSASLAQAQTTYQQNVVTVNTLVMNVLTSSLPALKNPPSAEIWEAFTSAYVQAEADALDWTNNVMGRLLSVPQNVQDYNNVIIQLLQDALNQANALVQYPENKAALAILQQDLKGLSTQLNIVTTFISGSVTAIQEFNNVLPDMATQLNNIAADATSTAGADQEQIDKLNQDIANLQNDIKQQAVAIAALGIAAGTAITLGMIATIAAWPVGALTWLVMGPVIAVAAVYITLDAKKIVADKAQIEQDQNSMDSLTSDIATLNVLAQNYTNLANATNEIEANLQAILNEWLALESDVNAAISDINTATADASTENFAAVVNDINAAITEWNAAYTQAGNLVLDLQANTAQLDIGMNSDQVAAAMANGKNVSIMEYYNQVGNFKKAA